MCVSVVTVLFIVDESSFREKGRGRYSWARIKEREQDKALSVCVCVHACL